METAGIIILCIALIAACIYINNLKTDNDFIRAQLSACRESMGNERAIHKKTVESLIDRLSEVKGKLDKAYERKITSQDSMNVLISDNKIKCIRGQMETDPNWSLVQKGRALEVMKKQVMDAIFPLAKVTKTREPYAKEPNIYDYEFWVADMFDQSKI